ncbi:caspase recruitment domain-containing protein 6 [Choloepus didactylus]|uniref:caspase recruitment domain-containing protein 6 n=1 Tax=Choloepus didactylus TaxID=27675 RepID=UPI00189E1DB0|nr:caspase recruitment domain-containing protein 6 [Choloepus didactylus]
MATDNTVPSEIIARERKKLLEILEQDPDSILDTLTSQRVISEEEFETLENVADPLKKSRKLLILVRQKGEVSCHHFLKCFINTFPESCTVWGLSYEFLKHGNVDPRQSMGVSKNSEDAFFSENKQPENPEITVSFKEKSHLDLETSESSRDKKTSDGETAFYSQEKDEKEYNTSEVTFSHSVEEAEYEIPATLVYLRDGQRYDEPDDSLYLGEEEYLGYVEYPEDAETPVEEESYNDPEYGGYDGEDSEYPKPTELSGDAQSYGDSETSMPLEEEAEEESMEEKKKVFEDVLSCLNMDRSRKLLPEFVQQFSIDHGYKWTPETPGDLAWNFLMKVQALDVTARESVLRPRVPAEDSKEELLTGMENLELEDIQTINPLDVLCASMLCSDSSLQCKVMSNMFQCQFALPLLLPDAENNKSILMLGAMKDIVKKQSTQSSGVPAGDTENFLTLMKMPVISFVRLGCCSFSKSRILNTLLCPAQLKSHKIFLHQDSPSLVLPRQISDGLVEITWCFPDTDCLKESSSFFQKPVAVANLRGDLESFWTQFGFLMEISSAVFFFTDYLGEKEWKLLMFLGETATERCYFVLNPQARESEESQIFQRILNLKPSQLLFLEGEEAEHRGENMEGLRAALQEVMCSSLKCVSVEDMAFLARELGIQVDKDYENAEGIQISPREKMAETAEYVGQQGQSQPKGSSESLPQIPFREAGVNQTPQNFHPTPMFMSYPQNSWPLLTRIGDNFNQVSSNPPWVMGSHFWSKQRSRWFHSSGFQSKRVHSGHKNFGFQYFQPQRFYSSERFMKFARTARGRHWNGTLGRPPRPIFQHVWAWPEKSQTMGAPERSGLVVSQVGHFHSLGSQPAGAVGKPQPGQACAMGTQPTEATGKYMRTTSHIKERHHQAFQPTAIGKPIRYASPQGPRLKTHGGPLNPAFQIGPCPMSKSKLLPSSQHKSSCPNPSQVKHSEPKRSQPVQSQPKPTQTKPTQPQPSQLKPSQSKPTEPKPSQSRSSHPKPSQSESTQPKPSQSMPSQPRSSQCKPSQSRPSPAKACYPRAGPKRGGKH